jgi:signal transduction histidine kinase/ligand-binding sensor domain-containing protein
MRILIASAVLIWCCPCAFALDTALDVSQYVHITWRVGEGFTKGSIHALAQTPDGYLWLGTELGLVRFDGVRAVPWQFPANQHLPSNNVLSLLAGRDGSLWIGTDKGLGRWKDGQLGLYAALAGSYVSRLLEDREGTIWMARFLTRYSVCSLQQARLTCPGEDGGRGADIYGLFQDRSGTLWTGTANGVWRWTSGSPSSYQPLGQQQANGIRAFGEDTDGSLLISYAGGLRRFVDGRAVLAYPFPSSIDAGDVRFLFRDRDRGLWAGTSSRGLLHIHDGVTDVYSKTDGLTSDDVSAVVEDREGTVWVATADGLDGFRESAVVSYSVKQGLSNDRVTSVLASGDGSVWVGTFDGLNRLRNGRVTAYRDGFRGSIESLFEDSARRMWVSTATDVGRLTDDGLVPVKGLPGGTMRAIVEDSHRSLWFAKPEVGLFRLVAGGFAVETIPRSAWRRPDFVSAMAADPAEDAVWLGFYGGGIARVADGHVAATYGGDTGLAKDRVSSLYFDSAGALWIATDGGLSWMRDGRIATLTSANGLPCDAVGWVTEDATHALWLGMPCGVARILRSDADAWVAGTQHARDDMPSVHPTLFDQSDGARILVAASYYTAPVARSSDGRLWFASHDGISVVDPGRLPVNKLPPPVTIEQVTADRRVYGAASGTGEPLRLPPLVRDLQIDYTALSLVAPGRNRFRYRLEGYDRDWQDVGNRRQAFYTNLPPRDYRFRVIASNNSGVWNDTGAVLDFSVAPAYYQTTWFLALSFGVIATLVWAAHRGRLRMVETHQREITALNERMMKAQEQERIRIAGELHDGVMQEMLAVTMMVGSVKRRIPGDSDARTTLDKMQQKLIQAGTDLRQLSHDLHPPLLQEAGLPKAVQSYCEQFSSASGIPVECHADDSVGELSRGAALALFRIVQEALGNAAKHAQASQITVQLTRADGTVTLSVADDGIGLDRSRLANGGGLGLVMMRERASQLNGTFDVESAAGRGTTIKVTIPFR